MREIKFRAWDGEKMTTKICIAGNGHKTTWDDDGEQFNVVLKNVDWSLMQYTGLKDKNGKDIYEGDLVIVEDIMGNPLDGWKDGLYIVEYCLPDCAFCLVQLDRRNAINFNEALEYSVTGNIYESKELLPTNP